MRTPGDSDPTWSYSCDAGDAAAVRGGEHLVLQGRHTAVTAGFFSRHTSSWGGSSSNWTRAICQMENFTRKFEGLLLQTSVASVVTEISGFSCYRGDQEGVRDFLGGLDVTLGQGVLVAVATDIHTLRGNRFLFPHGGSAPEH
ncbi:hypothetical protein CRUP_032276, partial [Coryphaenoides rupestris]